jgi:hypothetical protein
MTKWVLFAPVSFTQQTILPVTRRWLTLSPLLLCLLLNRCTHVFKIRSLWICTQVRFWSLFIRDTNIFILFLHVINLLLRSCGRNKQYKLMTHWRTKCSRDAYIVFCLYFRHQECLNMKKRNYQLELIWGHQLYYLFSSITFCPSF